MKMDESWTGQDPEYHIGPGTLVPHQTAHATGDVASGAVRDEPLW